MHNKIRTVVRVWIQHTNQALDPVNFKNSLEKVSEILGILLIRKIINSWNSGRLEVTLVEIQRIVSRVNFLQSTNAVLLSRNSYCVCHPYIVDENWVQSAKRAFGEKNLDYSLVMRRQIWIAHRTRRAVSSRCDSFVCQSSNG